MWAWNFILNYTMLKTPDRIDLFILFLPKFCVLHLLPLKKPKSIINVNNSSNSNVQNLPTKVSTQNPPVAKASFPCHPMATRSKTCTVNKKAFTATKHPLPTSYVSALSSNLPRDPASNGIGFLVKGGVFPIAFTRPKVISHACFLKKTNSLFALPQLSLN